MKVVALISGGKDSIFAILHCNANGHEVVALGNLHPCNPTSRRLPNAGSQDAGDDEDINSHMYQTVGHFVIPLFEDALCIPLYREPIVGEALQKGQTYTYNEHDDGTEISGAPPDEVESLTRLLKSIKATHPEINAVSTGAILSTYQRTRVESIAVRLGLTPLNFLWQYPYLPPAGRTTLLHDMGAAGIDARIIKVASGGLGLTHLWENVAHGASAARLERDMGRFGELDVGSTLGEGGEYETLAIDGPAPLWKKRIEVHIKDEWRVQGGDGVAHVTVKDARLTSKEHADVSSSIRIPRLLDEQSEIILMYCRDMNKHKFIGMGNQVPEGYSEPVLRPQEAISVTRHFVDLLNISGAPHESVHEQVNAIRMRVSSILKAHDLAPHNLSIVTLLLRSMHDFAEVNSVYGELFHQPLPPSRITIACGELLPPGVRLLLSGTASKTFPRQRRGLHVQSHSYWAPANIGPYSQAIALPIARTQESTERSSVIYIAGQIPLVPASMKMVDGAFHLHVVLALQHLWRIGRAMRVHWWIQGGAYITATSADEAAQRAAIALEAWDRAVHRNKVQTSDDEQDEYIDIGDTSLRQPWSQSYSRRPRPILSQIPDWSRCNEDRCMGEIGAPPCIVAQVEELPRGALVEWIGLGLALCTDQGGFRSFRSSHLSYHCIDINSQVCWTTFVAATREQVDQVMKRLDDESKNRRVRILEAYVAMPSTKVVTGWLARYCAQVIPCRSLWSEAGCIILSLRCRWVELPQN